MYSRVRSAMTPDHPVVKALQTGFPNTTWDPQPLVIRGPHRPAGDQFFVRIPPEQLLGVMRFLRDDAACRFEQLCDLTCVDYLNFPKAHDRYGVNYSLLSLT